VSGVRALVVVLRPLVLKPSQVMSVPAPGKAGWITLRSVRTSRDRRARAATVCVPLTQYAQRGQIVAVGWSAQTPTGFLGTILNLKGCNGFYASSVPLNQATVNGDTIDWSHPLQVVGKSLTKKTQSSFSQAITNNLSCSVGTTAQLTGSFDAGITPSLKASFSGFQVTSGSFSLTATADADLKLDVQGTAGCAFKRRLPPIPAGTFQVQMGPLPVVVVLQGVLTVDAQAQAGASIHADVAAHAQTTGGIGYDQHHGFAPIYKAPSLTFPTKTASFSGGVTGHLYVQPAIQALLYGAAGAKVTLSTGLDFTAKTSSNPWWTLTAPLDITGALTIPGLNKSTSNFGIYHQKTPFPILNAAGPFPGVAGSVSIVNPGNQTSTVGIPVNLQIHASDTDGGALSYSATGLPAGLSISADGVITGSPTSAAISRVTVMATDASGPSGSASFSWTITSGGPAGSKAIQVVDDGSTSCALLATGVIKCWGSNYSGGLGQPISPDLCNGSSYCTTPVQVPGIGPATAISTGQAQVCAVLATGGVDCWGDNFDGQLGNGTTTFSPTPVPVSGISNATAISTSAFNTCAVLADGSVKCWGDNEGGQLGNGTSTGPESCTNGPCSTAPVTVGGVGNATAIAVGPGWACALTAGGGVDCWGDDSSGQLGVGPQTPLETCKNDLCSTTAVSVAGIGQATAIASGTWHSCALIRDGSVDCWGTGGNGELGDGNSTSSPTPVPVSGISTATAISAGEFDSCAALADGTVDCWGENLNGEFGNGTTNSAATPVAAMSGATDAISISAGNGTACALRSTGGIECAGQDDAGQLGNGTATAYIDMPVSVSGIP
jgi:alpha-tubulin suppressor-like RCC1 family protein